MAAQQGSVQRSYRANMDAFHPGMLATQYPHSIKSSVFRASSDGQILKFGVGVGRLGADGVLTRTPDNFTGSVTGGARYAAGGGAYISDSITYESFRDGAVATAINSATTTTLALKSSSGTGSGIRINDLVRVANPTGDATREIMRVTGITAGSGSTTYNLTVIRGEYGTSASTSIAVDDHVFIYGRSSTFAGVAMKDITIDGRFTASEYDAFVDLDEVPVLVEGDIAVLVTSGSASPTTGSIVSADDPVSIYVGGTGSGVHWEYGRFSNQRVSDQDHIVIPGARYITQDSTATIYSPGQRGPGSGEENIVRVAAVRFNGNA